MSIISSVFNWSFQLVIYHPIFVNNCNNVFPSVLSYWSLSQREEATDCIVYTRHNQLKQISIRTIK